MRGRGRRASQAPSGTYIANNVRHYYPSYWTPGTNNYAINYLIKIDSPITLPSNKTSLYGYCDGCTSLVEGPEITNMSQVTQTIYMFRNCTSLVSVPNYDISGVTGNNAIGMFQGCSSLQAVPNLDFSGLTDTMYMFSGCSSLTSVPALNTINVTNFYDFFSACTNILSVGQIDVSSATNTTGMFAGCTNLRDVPVLNVTSSLTNPSDMFRNCPNLTDNSLNNIMAMMINSNSSTKKLTYIGITWEQAYRMQSLSNWQDFTNAGWTYN